MLNHFTSKDVKEIYYYTGIEKKIYYNNAVIPDDANIKELIGDVILVLFYTVFNNKKKNLNSYIFFYTLYICKIIF